MRSLLACTLFCIACNAAPDQAAPGGLTLPTDNGAVTGKLEGTTRAFLGIPFAAPPVDQLRWKPPQKAAAWTAPRDATAVGPDCPQIPPFGTGYDDASNEDCLTMNVWTPSTAHARPVMVWIYGGSFTSGSGGLSLYDGQQLSQAGDVVVVTFNYRLGALGFLGLPALTSEDPSYPSSGNYGIEDQRAALRWVHTNIAAFGGDPANVTVFGESAGAGSVFVHLVSPPSQGLFQRALAESGFYAESPTQSAAEAQGTKLATALGCSDAATVLACLRGKTAQQIVLALPEGDLGAAGVSWGPVLDGVNLPAHPFKLMHDGKLAHVPLLLGTNADEGTLFVSGQKIASDADYQAYVTALIGATGAPLVLAQYPSSSYSTPKAAAAALFGDLVFVCPSRRAARYSVAAGNATFLYRFNHVIDLPLLAGLGAFHSSELPFVFDNTYITFTPSGDEVGLSRAMTGYWTRFATGGDPNGGSAPAWPAYQAASDQNLTLDLTISPNMNLNRDNCDFWDMIATLAGRD